MFVLNTHFLLAVGKFGICVAEVPTYMASPQYKALTLESLMSFLIDYILHVWCLISIPCKKTKHVSFVTIEKGDLKAVPIFFHLLLVSLPFINFFPYSFCVISQSWKKVQQCWWILWGTPAYNWHLLSTLFTWIWQVFILAMLFSFPDIVGSLWISKPPGWLPVFTFFLVACSQVGEWIKTLTGSPHSSTQCSSDQASLLKESQVLPYMIKIVWISSLLQGSSPLIHPTQVPSPKSSYSGMACPEGAAGLSPLLPLNALSNINIPHLPMMLVFLHHISLLSFDI